jgi:hypothetical protein
MARRVASTTGRATVPVAEGVTLESGRLAGDPVTAARGRTRTAGSPAPGLTEASPAPAGVPGGGAPRKVVSIAGGSGSGVAGAGLGEAVTGKDGTAVVGAGCASLDLGASGGAPRRSVVSVSGGDAGRAGAGFGDAVPAVGPPRDTVDGGGAGRATGIAGASGAVPRSAVSGAGGDAGRAGTGFGDVPGVDGATGVAGASGVSSLPGAISGGGAGSASVGGGASCGGGADDAGAGRGGSGAGVSASRRESGAAPVGLAGVSLSGASPRGASARGAVVSLAGGALRGALGTGPGGGGTGGCSTGAGVGWLRLSGSWNPLGADGRADGAATPPDGESVVGDSIGVWPGDALDASELLPPEGLGGEASRGTLGTDTLGPRSGGRSSIAGTAGSGRPSSSCSSSPPRGENVAQPIKLTTTSTPATTAILDFERPRALRSAAGMKRIMAPLPSEQSRRRPLAEQSSSSSQRAPSRPLGCKATTSTRVRSAPMAPDWWHRGCLLTQPTCMLSYRS